MKKYQGETQAAGHAEAGSIVFPAPPPLVCFVYTRDDRVTSVIRIHWAYGHMVPATPPYISPLWSPALPLFPAYPSRRERHEHHGSRPPRKHTSVGSLSNSTALLHHNRPPAVRVDILPATTLRGEEVQSDRAARLPFWHIEPSCEVGSRSKGSFSTLPWLTVCKASHYRWEEVREQLMRQWGAEWMHLLLPCFSLAVPLFHLSSHQTCLPAPFPHSWHQHR